MDRDNLGRFTKESKYWLGKKRPGFKSSTTFSKGMIPWNKGLNKSDPRVMKYVSANYKDMIEKKCDFCDKKYFVVESRKGKSRFCSRKCKSMWVSINACGSKSKCWTGDNIGYFALHNWVRKMLGKPMKCEKCRKTFKDNRKLHWANISGKYKRDLKDWIRLCVSCHKKYDKNRREQLRLQ